MARGRPRSELGHALRSDGPLDEAEAVYRQSIHGWQRSGNRGAVANELELFALVALARGNGVRAARLFGASEVPREVADAQMTSLERAECDAPIVRLCEALDEAALSLAWAEGRLIKADAAVAFALSG